MMEHKLTAGAIATMLQGGKIEAATLQVMSHKKVAGDADRYRLLISDGCHMNSLAMLGTQLSHMIHDNQLSPNTIIRLNRYVANTVQGGSKKVFILLDITVLVPGAQATKIGEPTMYNPQAAAASGGGAANGAAALPAAAAPAAYGGGAAALVPPTINPQTIVPIAHLTPYSNKWTVKARVTSKGDVRTWNNARGEGKLFSFELLDESGEIRCTAFKEQCDKYYDMIEPKKVYYLTRATLKPANKQFCGSITHDFELTLNHDSVLEPCADEGDIPGMQYTFVPISELEKMDKTGLVDIIGVCKETGDLDRIMSRKLNKELTKRDIKLVDQSNTEVTLTIWGSQAETFEGTTHPVVALKGARLSDFNGCSLSSGSSTKMDLNPDLDEAFKLKGWFDNGGCNAESMSISKRVNRNMDNFKTFEEAKLENIGGTGEAGYYSVCATVLQLKSENCLYQACPNGDCKKKVLDQQNGMYRCEKCNQEFPEFRWRILMQMNIADMTGNQWCTAFQEQAETILGTTCEDLGRLKTADMEDYTRIFSRANFKQFNMRLRVKMETYNDESRLRSVVASVTPVANDLETHKKRLQDEIVAMGGSLDKMKMK